MPDAAWFLTFRTYGSWLHGDARGSVDREHNEFGEPSLLRDDGLRRRSAARMKSLPVLLDTSAKRVAVAQSLARTCSARGWTLLAENVRTNHVHLVVVADGTPIEKGLASFKAWATRALRESELVPAEVEIWAHHGSTRYLRDEAAVEAAVNYTLFEQGPPPE